MTDQKHYLVSYYNPGEYFAFDEFVEEQTESVVSLLEEAAADQWDRICGCLPWADDEELGDEMQRWWDRQIRRFHDRMYRWHEQWRSRRLKRRLDREKQTHSRTKEELEATQTAHQETKDNLEVERLMNAQMREIWLCRRCNAANWN